MMLMIISLAGCEVKLNNNYILWAGDVCKDNGGLKAVSKADLFYPEAYCVNGARFEYKYKDDEIY